MENGKWMMDKRCRNRGFSILQMVVFTATLHPLRSNQTGEGEKRRNRRLLPFSSSPVHLFVSMNAA
jgi:hypothetical protein